MGAICSFLSECVQKHWISSMNHIKDQLEQSRGPVCQFTGLGLTMTLTTLFLPASNAKTTYVPSNLKKPITQKPVPERLFQETSVHMLSMPTYLIILDCFTDWPAIISLDRGTNALQVTSAIRQLFCHNAIPDMVWSDGSPHFTSKVFKDFTKCWDFLHKVSSPCYPQSNGKVKATVKSMKKLIHTSWTGRSLDHDKLCHAIIQYQNTLCRKDGLSPAQILFGHPVQDTYLASPPPILLT